MIISSTNRSNKSKEKRAINKDYYVTPIEPIIKFLNEFQHIENYTFKDKLILDPCAGGDINNDMSYPKALKQIGATKVATLDIRQDSKAYIKTDYLTYDLPFKPNMIITNPPFNIAIDIIKKALNDIADGCWVIMLQRLNFFGTIERKPFWDEFMPQYAFVHNKRMSFIKGSSTDSIEYAHYVWKKNDYPEFCKLKVI